MLLGVGQALKQDEFPSRVCETRTGLGPLFLFPPHERLLCLSAFAFSSFFRSTSSWLRGQWIRTLGPVSSAPGGGQVCG